MTTHVRTKQWLQLRRTWPLFIMLLPAIVYLLIFAYYPMYGAMIAFKNYTITDGILGSRWVGLDHFVQFLSYYRFGELVRNTLRISIYGMCANFVIKLTLSLSLNCLRNERYKKLIQTVTYMPHFISTVVMVGIVIQFFNPRLGVIARLIQMLGGSERDLMGESSAVPHI